MNDWKEFTFWGILGGALRILIDYKGKSIIQFVVGLVIAVVVSMIVGNLALGIGLNKNLAFAIAAACAVAGDNIAVGVMELSKKFKENPLTTLSKLLQKKGQ